MDELELKNDFNDFAEVTEYFYNEVGKYSASIDKFKRKKDHKWIYNRILENFKLNLDIVTKSTKSKINMDDVNIKELDKKFNSEHNSESFLKKSFFFFVKPIKFLKKFNKKSKTEIISPDKVSLLSNDSDSKN